jgi:hypothetical protein
MDTEAERMKRFDEAMARLKEENELAGLSPAEKEKRAKEKEIERVRKIYLDKAQAEQTEREKQEAAHRDKALAPVRAREQAEAEQAKSAARAEFLRLGGDPAKFDDHWQSLLNQGRGGDALERVRQRAWRPSL